MEAWQWFHNRVVAAVVLIFFGCAPGFAQTLALDGLFTRLLDAEAGEAQRIEREIWLEWSKSGSPAMDLLLERGRQAMAMGENLAAIDHLTALTDHAPDFAEGWNARATAYFNAGMLGPSVVDIGHVLTLNPRHFGALSGLGMIFEQLGKPEQALAAYRAALAIHPRLAAVMDSVQRLEQDLAGQDL